MRRGLGHAHAHAHAHARGALRLVTVALVLVVLAATTTTRLATRTEAARHGDERRGRGGRGRPQTAASSPRPVLVERVSPPGTGTDSFSVRPTATPTAPMNTSDAGATAPPTSTPEDVVHAERESEQRQAYQSRNDAILNAKPIAHALSDADKQQDRVALRRGGGAPDVCVSFEEAPRQPPASAGTEVFPWTLSKGTSRACKVYMRWNEDFFICSATLVGKDKIAMARHCTFSACEGSREPDEMFVMCGFSWVPPSPWLPHLQYDWRGTAHVTGCESHVEFDNSVRCVDGGDASFLDYDVQYCRLDREVGVGTGWYGLSTAVPHAVTVRGYPGNPDLVPFFGSGVLNQPMYHQFHVTAAFPRYFVLQGAWLYGGESGAGYVNTATSQVTAVHRGGPSGCVEYGARVTSTLVAKLAADPSNPPDYCELVPYPLDVYNVVGPSVWGVALALTSAVQPTVAVQVGGTVRATASFFNPGNKPATNVVVNWYVSENDFVCDADALAATQTIATIGPNSVAVVTSPPLSVTWVGSMYVGALASGGGCLPRANPNHVPSGLVTSTVDAPTSSSPTRKPTVRRPRRGWGRLLQQFQQSE